MSLTTAVIAVVGLDLAVLAALAHVMRMPFRAADDRAVPVEVAVQPVVVQPREARPARRYVRNDARTRTAQSAVR